MSLTPVQSSSQRKIQSSLKRWKGTLEPGQRELFKNFVTEAVPRLRGPYLAQHRPRQVLKALEAAFQFAQVRRDDIAVAITARDKGVSVFSNMVDQPFIVDTMRLFIRNSKADYISGFNLVFKAVRDEDGRLTTVGGDQGRVECIVLLEADGGRMLHDVDGALATLKAQLRTAQATVRDFKAMTRTVERFAEKFEIDADRDPGSANNCRETAAFLKWLLRENFVFMGLDSIEPLGIQTLDQGRFYNTATGDWPAPHEPGTVRVRKSTVESPIHRSGRIDEVLVTLGHGDDAQHLFIRGLFTYRAVTQPCRNVPILRGVLGAILKQVADEPGSYRYKGMANVFDSLPTELLLTANIDAITTMTDLVFEAEQASDVGVTFIRASEDASFALVAMPKTQYSDDLARTIEDTIVRTLKATYTDHGLFVGRYDTVLAHWYMTGIRHQDDDALQILNDKVRQLATPWHARLWMALSKQLDDTQADRLADTYGRAFPESYTRSTSAERTVRDIQFLDDLTGRKNVLADVYEQDGSLYLRLYQARDVFLTDILPVLDNFGLVVRESWATEVKSRGGRLFLDTFVLEPTPVLSTQAILERSELLKQAMEAVFSGSVEDDPLNQLVLTSGLAWREVDLIRGYTEYSRQLTVKLSANRLVEILLENPQMCHALVGYFHARFDPDVTDRAAAIAKAADLTDEQLRRILSHDEDLVFSTLYELLSATTRANFYRTDRKFHYLSFKLDCSKVDSMGVNRPLYEIYVHHREVEGVHLRFGKVARGGLRWSDRDDYRTEVLGLVTTQLVKNVVIVPTGSKGGFYLKRPSPDGKLRRQQADHHYKTFIRGLLDLTDNTVNGKTVKPPRVVTYDGDDPYLVVAADKGTAHLSDTANSLSREYGYWLDDAFASGGSVGYDHKGVGITARGAWVLVRRHFAERGIDPYTQEFTCVGIGDMGGDVFGNGLIESEHTLLHAAFNHLHIFLDPQPDAARSYVERKRLFDKVGGWAEYDLSTVSEGGGVYDRRAKSIPLSPQAQEMLGIEADEADPNDVINAILRMEVDLLWNGGIGTYVKASNQTDAQADDRSNDLVRIDAPQLRAKIVGEGGNLGFTQRARIEADQHGVRLNTDAIDNSGGVDLSDHEVNLKILLNLPVGRGELSSEQRNAVLAEMADEVADLVLLNNEAHGRQISRDQIRSKQDIFQFGRAIAFIEARFGIRRKLLALPSESELSERAEQGLGLTRPELAVISAWVKMYVYQQLLDGSPRDIPGYEALLFEYFPKKVQKTWPDDIRKHMLADEIAMTVATTRMVADAGAAFFPIMLETTGASVPDIATAYLKAQDLAQTAKVRKVLEELRTSVSLSSLYASWVLVDAGAREVASYWLSARGRIPSDEELAQMLSAAQQVYDLQDSTVNQRNRSVLDEYKQHDIPENIGELVLKAQYLNITLMIWADSVRQSIDFPQMVVQHLAVARASRLQELLDDLSSRPATGRWDPIALRILNHRFHQLLRQLVAAVPMHPEGACVDDLVPVLEAGRLADVRSQVDELLEGDQPSVATLLVLEERIASAISRLQA